MHNGRTDGRTDALKASYRDVRTHLKRDEVDIDGVKKTRGIKDKVRDNYRQKQLFGGN